MSVTVAGEALVDLVDDGDVLRIHPGGSAFNVAVGVGRLDVACVWLGRLGGDRLARRLEDALTGAGVGLDLAERTDEPTTLAIADVDENGRATYHFHLAGTSASGWGRSAIPQLPGGGILHVSYGAITAEHEPAGRALAGLLVRERGRQLRCLDPNVRPAVIEDLERYAVTIDTLLDDVDVLRCSDEDLRLLYPDGDPLDVAAARAEATDGPRLVIVTRGAQGVDAFAATSHLHVDTPQVDVADTVGAGDAFSAGLLAWLDAARIRTAQDLDECDLEAGLSYAARVAAVTCTRPGADPPRRDEVGAPPS